MGVGAMLVPVCQEIPDQAVNAAHHLLSGMTAGGGVIENDGT